MKRAFKKTKDERTFHEKAIDTVKEHNHEMRKYTTQLVPHPTVAKTWIEVQVLKKTKKPKV